MDNLDNLSQKQRQQLGIRFVPFKTDTKYKSTIKTPIQKTEKTGKSQKQSYNFFSFLSPIKTNTQ